jgi:hypothetical protein
MSAFGKCRHSTWTSSVAIDRCCRKTLGSMGFPGSGRPPGAISARSREVAERAIAEGITPLEVMLDNMRFHHAEAGKLLDKLLVEGVPEVESAVNGDGADRPHAKVIQADARCSMLRNRAGEEAARVAPYASGRTKAVRWLFRCRSVDTDLHSKIRSRFGAKI